jgi:Gp49-like protein DUF891
MPDVRHGRHNEHWRAGCHGNRARPVRRGAVGKGPGQLAPRRRPTLPHAGCGGRIGETHQEQSWQGAPIPPNPPSAGRSEVRILLVFDPWRSVVLLVAGDKSGQWTRWYRTAIPQAEQLYADYLAEREKEMGP